MRARRTGKQCPPCRYPKLHQEFARLVKAFITPLAASSSAATTSLLENEDTYISVDHRYFFRHSVLAGAHPHVCWAAPRVR